MINNLGVQNKKYIANFGAVTSPNNFGMNTQPSNTSPQMQAQLDAAALADAANKVGESATDSYLGQRATAFSDIDPKLQLGVTIPTWIAINQAMDLYMKKCGGNYDSSLVAKYGKAGDKVSHILFDNKIGRALGRGLEGFKGFFKTKIYDKSALMKAFHTTPSQPDLKLVKSQLYGIQGMTGHDIISLTDTFLEPVKSAKDLDCLGATKEQIAKIEQDLAKIIKPENKTLFLQTEEYKLLSSSLTPNQLNTFKCATEAERLNILKELKLKNVLKFSSASEYELIKQAPEKSLDKILEMLKRVDDKYLIREKYSSKNIGTIAKGELLGRKVKFSELHNVLYGSFGGNHRTVLGKTAAKLSNQIMEGATSRISGGKVAALMQAFFLAEVIIRANRQEGIDNKFKSFMERFAELIGFFVFMPPSIKLTYKLGGLKYAGMTPEQVDAYRKAVTEFNSHVMNKEWTKAIYKQKRAELMTKFRPKTKNPITWLGRKIGDIVSVGLDQVRPYSRKAVEAVDLSFSNIGKNKGKYLKDVGKRIKDVAINPKYWFKQAAGYPVRFILPMFILVPFFNKILVKGVNKIFGKPKEGALLDEGKEEKEVAKAEQTNTQNINNPQVAVVPAAQQVEQNANPVQTNQTTYKGVETITPETIVVKNEQELQKEIQKEVNKGRYIPSSEPVKLSGTKNNDDALERALNRADQVEKMVYARISDNV